MKGSFGELAGMCKVCNAKIDLYRTLKIEIFSVDGKRLCSLKWKPPLCSEHSGQANNKESLQFKIAWEKSQ